MSSSDPDRDDDRLRRALQSLPAPETPSLELRVRERLRSRRVRQVGAASVGVAAFALVALFVWQPWRGEASLPMLNQPAPVAQSPRDIPADDLDVLFAPPPVDSLAVLDRHDAVSVAALNRLEGVK